jgi:sulfopropanediol 3-dehydrogenase
MIPLLHDDKARAWLQKRTEQWQKEQVPNAENKLAATVAKIIAEVQAGGDNALDRIALSLNDPPPRSAQADSPVVQSAISELPESTKDTIRFAAGNIATFAKAVVAAIKPVRVQYAGYEAGLDLVPVQRAACYVPGGRYPLPSTALMTAITAQVAGVKEIALFTPVLRPEILFAGSLAGVHEFHELGGAQAIAAAAFGTESIKSVDMIVGPGNAYVAEAKRQVQGIVGIDMLAGPSEIAVIADAGGTVDWVALDMLSQAEHDPDASAYLLTDSKELANAVANRLPALAKEVGAPQFVKESLGKSAILVLASLAECAAAANEIAPEHLVLHMQTPEVLKPLLKNYGALFLGYANTVPYGDYAAGPNHTLPTNRSARFSGSLNPLTFMRAQSWLNVANPTEELARRSASFADLEGLKAHAAASRARIALSEAHK